MELNFATKLMFPKQNIKCGLATTWNFEGTNFGYVGFGFASAFVMTARDTVKRAKAGREIGLKFGK